MTAPALFISHGAPTFALEPGLLGPKLRELGSTLSGLRAVLVVSPHWQTSGPIRVMHTAQPETVHDFHGFGDQLHELQYPAPGAPQAAIDTARVLESASIEAQLDDSRGFDHGAWVPMRYLLPDADLPVFQLSLPIDLDTLGALRLGRTLRVLRESGIAIVGSGSMTHNLYEFRRSDIDAQYAQEFAEWVRSTVNRKDIDGLLAYLELAPHATRAHPTEEHFLPLLIAIGASWPDETGTCIEGGLTHGILSMDSFAWGQLA